MLSSGLIFWNVLINGGRIFSGERQSVLLWEFLLIQKRLIVLNCEYLRQNINQIHHHHPRTNLLFSFIMSKAAQFQMWLIIGQILGMIWKMFVDYYVNYLLYLFLRSLMMSTSGLNLRGWLLSDMDGSGHAKSSLFLQDSAFYNEKQTISLTQNRIRKTRGKRYFE